MVFVFYGNTVNRLLQTVEHFLHTRRDVRVVSENVCIARVAERFE